MRGRREVVVIAPTACLGLMEFSEEAFEEALKYDPIGIGVDAGSLDPGPTYLGAGLPHTSRLNTKREIDILLRAVRKRKIPLVIGTAGGSGGRPHIEWNLDLIKEVVAERKIEKFKLAVIDTTLDKDYLKERALKERIEGCQHDKKLTPEDVDACTEIVAQIGMEPIIEALNQGADVVLAGRACDDADIAAIPVRAGFDKGLCLHFGKIAECGGLAAEPSRGYSSMIGIIGDDYFLIKPGDQEIRCTIASVVGHAIYERTHPDIQEEPGGILDTSRCTFEQYDERTVKITGSKWIKSDVYKIKLEGAEKVGYRALFMGGARDPAYIKNIDYIVSNAKRVIREDMAKKEGLKEGEDFYCSIHVYGRDGVMGPLEIQREPGSHELFIMLDIVAKTKELARDVCYYGKNPLVWGNFPGRITTAGNLAYPFSPSILEVGDVYKLRIHHLLPIEDPLMFPIKMMEVGS